MRTVLIPLLALALLPLAPSTFASHQGCNPASTTPTHEVGQAGQAVYVVVQGTHVWVYMESNGVPGLQTQGGCGHAADSQLAEACGRVDTRIPGTIACVVDTA